jgi:hypothetical protein
VGVEVKVMVRVWVGLGMGVTVYETVGVPDIVGVPV